MVKENLRRKMYNADGRQTDIDLAKGIAIILVVMGHSYSQENVLVQWFSSFHMSLFFIVCGILYKLKQSGESTLILSKYNPVIKKKCYTLLLPYVVLGTLWQCFLGVLQYIGGNRALSEMIRLKLKSILYLNSGIMWFLPTLFIAEMIFFIPLSNKLLKIAVITILTMIGLFFPLNINLLNVFLRGFVGCGFIAIGYYGCVLWRKPIKMYQVIIVEVIHILFVWYNGNVGLVGRNFGNPFLFMLNGVLGSFVLMQCCIKMDSMNWILKKSLRYWGQYSIIILCTHTFIIEILRLLDSRIFSGILSSLGIAEGIVVTTVTMILLSLVMPICQRYFWWAFGLNKLRFEESIP